MHSVVNCWPISATREGWHHPQSLDQVLLLRVWIVFQTQKYFPDQNRQQRPFFTLLLPVLSSIHRLTISWSKNTTKTLSDLPRKHLSAEPQLGLRMEQGWWALRPVRYMSSVILLCSAVCSPPNIGFSKGTERTGRPYFHQDHWIQTFTLTFCWRRCWGFTQAYLSGDMITDHGLLIPPPLLTRARIHARFSQNVTLPWEHTTMSCCWIQRGSSSCHRFLLPLLPWGCISPTFWACSALHASSTLPSWSFRDLVFEHSLSSSPWATVSSPCLWVSRDRVCLQRNVFPLWVGNCLFLSLEFHIRVFPTSPGNHLSGQQSLW